MSFSKHGTIKKKNRTTPILPFTNGSCGSSILLNNNLKLKNINSTDTKIIIPNNAVISSMPQTIYLNNYDDHIPTNDHINKDLVFVENVQNEIIIDDEWSDNMQLLSDDDGNVYCVQIENNRDAIVIQDEEPQIESNDNSNSESLDINNDFIQNETEIQMDTAIGMEDVDIKIISDVVEALKCKWCSFTTLDKDSLIVHRTECHSQNVDTSRNYYMNVGKDKIMYICGKCSKTLSSVEECRNHMINDHKFQAIEQNDKNTETEKLNETQSPENSNARLIKHNQKLPTVSKVVQEFWLTPKTLKEVKWKLQGDKTIRCTNSPCLYRFKSIETMNAHRACHTESTLAVQKSYQRSPHKTQTQPFVCTSCNTNFNSWPSCSLHLWREHTICLDLLTCPLCFTVKTHSVSKMVQHISRHWRNQQENAEKLSDDKNELPRWYATTRCEICQKMLSDCKSLKKHVQSVHKKIKPFICNVCNHSATTKHMMQLHMRQHTGEKPFACEFCSYRTGDHNTLRRHRMKHTGERPYKCSHCTYSCIQSVALKHHLRKHH